MAAFLYPQITQSAPINTHAGHEWVIAIGSFRKLLKFLICGICVIWGWSIGGTVLQLFAVRLPDCRGFADAS